MTRPVKPVPIVGIAPKPRPETEVGVPLHLPFVTPYRNAWEVLRDDAVTVKQLIAMRRTDGQARALYRLITLPIRAALKTATFVPGTNVEGGDDEAKFIEDMLTLPASAGGMTVPFHKVIAQLLMAIFDGFSVHEMVYWQPKTGPLKGKWTIKKLAHRPAETLTFLIDRHGECTGVRQRTMFQNREIDVVIDAENMVRYTANEEERPFYGESYFQSAFYHWDKKFKLYTIAHLACQRAAVGTRVGKLPPNPSREEKAAFQKSLADLTVAQWMTMPDTYGLESLKEGPNFDFLAYINHHNSQMSKSVLAAFFDKEQGGGDSGKLVDFGQQSDSLFLLMLQTIMGEIEEVINQQIIPRFIYWNFPNGTYPKFQFGSLSQEQKGAILDLFKQLAVAGQSLTIQPEFLHEITKVVAEDFGLEIDWETIEEEIEAEKELAAQQKQLELEQQQAMADAPATGPDGSPTMPDIDGSLIPEGFTLLTADPDEATIALTQLAADLIDEAYLELAGGPLRGPRTVRTPAGAQYYGEPVGATITPNQEQATAKEGVKGKVFGAGIRGKQQTGGGPGAPGTTQTHGGGPGAAPQRPGGTASAAKLPKAKAYYGNPKAPGAVLLDFGDGTVAIRDPNGRTSPRQRFDIKRFAALGWKAQTSATEERQATEKTNTTGNKEVKPAKKATRANRPTT